MVDADAEKSHVIPVLTETQQIDVLKIQRKVLNLKTRILEITKEQTELFKEYEAAMLALNAATDKVINDANFDATGHVFDHETLTIKAVV